MSNSLSYYYYFVVISIMLSFKNFECTFTWRWEYHPHKMSAYLFLYQNVFFCLLSLIIKLIYIRIIENRHWNAKIAVTWNSNTINSTNSGASDAHFGNQCLTSDVMLEAKLIENSKLIKRIKNYKPKRTTKV